MKSALLITVILPMCVYVCVCAHAERYEDHAYKQGQLLLSSR